MDVDTALGKLMGLLVKFGWVGGVGLLIFGAYSAWREHNLTGISGLLIIVGVAACAVSIVSTMFGGLTGLALNISPTD